MNMRAGALEERRLLPSRRQFGLAAGIVVLGILAMHVGQDILIFKRNIEDRNCCGWVDARFYMRPYTSLMVDRWTDPQWVRNQSGTQELLIQHGYVDGKEEFWRSLDKRQIQQPLR